MNGVGWCLLVIGYLLGVVALSLSEGGWQRDELAALFGWPVVFPVMWPIMTWKRWRRRCPSCKRRYVNRAVMLRHHANCVGCTQRETAG